MINFKKYQHTYDEWLNICRSLSPYNWLFFMNIIYHINDLLECYAKSQHQRMRFIKNWPKKFKFKVEKISSAACSVARSLVATPLAILSRMDHHLNLWWGWKRSIDSLKITILPFRQIIKMITGARIFIITKFLKAVSVFLTCT